MAYNPRIHKPLTEDEVKERYVEIQEEWDEVNKWFLEESEKLKNDDFKTHQAKSACKRNLEKAKRRVDSVRGTMEYWKNRVGGMTHFRASIIMHEYWESLKQRDEKEKNSKKETKLPDLLKNEKKKDLPNILKKKIRF